MNEDGDGKKPTIPLTTVSEIVSRTIDGKVKVSKSFMKLVRRLPMESFFVDAGVRKRVHWAAGHGIGDACRKGPCEDDW